MAPDTDTERRPSPLEQAKKQALDHATHRPIKEIVAWLQEKLGQDLTAIIAGVSDEKQVSRWAKGSNHPRVEAETAMRNAYQIVEWLLTREDEKTIRAWMRGMNYLLEDRPPAFVLRERPQDVAGAAEAFLA